MAGYPPWRVLLLGGASGVGKTCVSYRLARHYGVGIVEVDDFQIVLERMTSPDRYPVLHFWRIHPDEAQAMGEEQLLAHTLAYAAVMAEALEPVIANHLETSTPLVLEGDFILPALAAQADYNGIPAEGQVRGLFLLEDDEEQLRRNYLLREGEEQPRRARASWCYSNWLRQESERLGVPAITARPWDTVLERAIATIDGTVPA
jgi:2-phosphoglycerate kinase